METQSTQSPILAMPVTEDETQRLIARVRSFNRFYTQQMGVVNMLGSGLSMATARVIFEIERRGKAAAVELTRDLEIDSGYMSRILRGLEQRGLLRRQRCEEDGRRHDLALTESGQRVYEDLTDRADTKIGALLAPVVPEDRSCLIEAMDQIETILDPKSQATPCRIHEHGPGDLSWVVFRHGVLYSRALGVDERFEARVAGIIADFGTEHDSQRERLWIAELEGERVGSIMLARVSDEVARLRLFLVEPRIRHRGVGSQLLDTCVGFAQRRGYARIVLSTLEALKAARGLYERKGFRLIETKPHNDWGVDVVEEEWELEL